MFSNAKGALKEFFFAARSRPVRLALDALLERRAVNGIALTDYSRVHQAIRVPLQAELGKILSFRTEFETELYVRRFEADFAARCGRRFAVGTHSGTSALQLCLVALGIGPGDEVVTAANTYVATALAISNTGAKPVFVDVETSTFNLDPRRIEAAITSATKAIMPVHLYGQMANMPEIMRVAEAHGLRVVEDACQAFGADLGGRKAGSVGHAGCFSFSTPKNLSGFGNGGMVVADDKALIEKIRLLRNPEANHLGVRSSRRTPCYLDAMQIAFLRAKLPFATAWTEMRQAHAERYREALSGAPVTLPIASDGARHVYYRFAIRTSRRDQLRKWLQKHRIRTAAPYAPCLPLTQTYADLGYAPGSFPVSEAAERESLLLPISPFLTDEERETVSRSTVDFFAA